MPGATLDLVVRADATPSLGAGHLMRCAALGEAWLGLGLGPVRIHGQVEIEFVRHRLEQIGARVGPAPASPPGVLVVDSYDPAVRETAASAPGFSARVMVDDLGGPVPDGFAAVWNPSPAGANGLYHGFRGRLITGPDHLAIRAGLPRWRAPGVNRTAVVLGGGAIGATLIGAACQLRQAVAPAELAGLGNWVPADWQRLDPDDPWPAIVACDRLLTGAGSTVWEAAAVGIPVAVVRVAANQDRICRWVVAAGVPLIEDPEGAPHELAQRLGMALAEARPLPPLSNGAERVARLLHHLAAPPLRLRRARQSDAKTLWLWANDAETRQASHGRPPIPWLEHLGWLAGQLDSGTAHLLIAEDSTGALAGSIRFDTVDGWGTARLSYAIAPEKRGLGLSRELVASGVAWLRAISTGVTIRAEVMGDNERSLRVFRALGWEEDASAGDRVVFRSR